VNVLGLGEIRSILDRRASLLQDGVASDPSRSALQSLVEWSYDLLHGDEKTLLQQLAVHRGGASLASLVAVAGAHGLNEATVAYLVGALVDKSIVSASFADGAARYDMLDTVREYVLDGLAAAGGLPGVRARHAEYFATVADGASAGLRGPDWLVWRRRLEAENDNVWAALGYAQEAPDPALAARLGRLGWYFALADRVSEGRRFLDLAVAAAGDDAPGEAQIETLATLCYLATEEHDLEAALVAGERARALTAGAETSRAIGLAHLTLALAAAGSGDSERAAALAQDAFATFEALADDWGLAATGVIHAIGAAVAGDVATTAAMAAVARRHADAVNYDAFRVPVLLLEGWVAERREDGTEAASAYEAAFELARRIGFPDHAAFALAALGSAALAGGNVGEAEALEQQALAAAEDANAPWVAAHARVQLGRAAAASGDTETAGRLFDEVLEWSRAQRPHGPRESLFLALAGSPGAAAERGLAEIAA
jgi:tetratricopeptide (TPR) repeat protein